MPVSFGSSHDTDIAQTSGKLSAWQKYRRSRDAVAVPEKPSIAADSVSSLPQLVPQEFNTDEEGAKIGKGTYHVSKHLLESDSSPTRMRLTTDLITRGMVEPVYMDEAGFLDIFSRMRDTAKVATNLFHSG